jgi:hypothetical protein
LQVVQFPLSYQYLIQNSSKFPYLYYLRTLVRRQHSRVLQKSITKFNL